MSKPTVYRHRRHDGEIIMLCHHSRNMVLLDVTRGYPRPMEKVDRVPEITAALEKLVRDHAAAKE